MSLAERSRICQVSRNLVKMPVMSTEPVGMGWLAKSAKVLVCITIFELLMPVRAVSYTHLTLPTSDLV